MKLMVKIALSFVGVVLVFGAIMILLNYQSVQREKDNTTKMYEERGLSIAKALDASITSEQQLNSYAQTIINKTTYNHIGIYQFDIFTKAPEGKSDSVYWKVASSITETKQEPADPEDIAVIENNEYSVTYITEFGVKIINIIYPLHDVMGNAIGAAGIKFDMTPIDKMMVPSTTYIYTIVMLVVALLIALYLAYSITKPIKQLTDVANKVSTGEMDVKMPDIKSKDEIGDLAKSFGRMVASIKFMMTDKEG
ncbi:MAG: HAMP domain-containing protein [Dehalococcoidales bacterium]